MARKKSIDSTIQAEEMTQAPEMSPKERADKCNEEVAAVMAKYNCDLHVSMLLDPPNGIRPLVRIVPKV